MRTLACLGVVVAFALVLGFGSHARGDDAPGDAEPAVFRDLTPREALALSKSEGKILIVRWTATWCGPCKRMDKTTWPDARVVAWVGERAIAISADLDAQRRGAEIHRINAVPTMIAFKDGKELDRIVGYRTPNQLLEWFAALEAGDTADARLATEIAAVPHTGGEAEVDARYELAGKLLEAGRFTEAADEYVWLWENIETEHPAMSGVRVSYMAGNMQQLAQQSEACRARFGAMRDALVPRIALGPEFDEDAFDDWVVLNSRVLDDSAAMIAWAENADVEPNAPPQRVDQFRTVRSELIKLRRWDLAAKFAGDPVSNTRREIAMQRRIAEIERENTNSSIPEEHRATIEAMTRTMNRNTLAEQHVLALTLGLDQDARTIAEVSMEFDPSDEMRVALVQMAMGAGQVRPMHAEMLEGCASATEYLKEAVAKEIAAKAATSSALP